MQVINFCKNMFHYVLVAVLMRPNELIYPYHGTVNDRNIVVTKISSDQVSPLDTAVNYVTASS